MNIAIVEDENFYRDQLVEYLENFEKENKLNIEVKIFTDGYEFITNYDAQFDIILMDIQMPLMDGMSAAEELRKVDSKTIIIFITNASQYAIRGYEVAAFDYILKPINYFHFSERLLKAYAKIENNEEKFITIKSKNGYRRLNVNDIYYIESQGHDLIFYVKNDIIDAIGTMKKFEKDLINNKFFRVHRGYLVNLNHVEGINERGALIGDMEVPISRGKRKEFMDLMVTQWDL